MRKFAYNLIKRTARYVPTGLKEAVRSRLPSTDYDIYLQEEADPFANEPPAWAGKPGPLIGIIYEYTHYHKFYIHACRELEVSYQVIDISRSDWMEVLENSPCDAYLVWPSSTLSIWKDMFDDRLYFLSQQLKKIVYPSCLETWLYENKRRVNYWLTAHKIPHPHTEIFYNQAEAEAFIRKTALPVVLKTNTGASASGVYILRDRKEAERMIRRAFTKGIVARRHHPLDKNWGYVILQEYIAIVREWRMVRMGDSFFGHPKGRMGDFHSGSGVALWDIPPAPLLDFVREVTNRGNFTSMDVDIFETEDGRYLVNELQTVFGASVSIDQLRMDGKPGRMVYDAARSAWQFEAGDFARNACANARLQILLDILSAKGQ